MNQPPAGASLPLVGSTRPGAPRRDPSQQRSAETVAAILDAANRVLEREGPGALTTRRVAAVAGVSVGTLYQYFRNKDALVLALERRTWGAMLGELQLALGHLVGMPVREALPIAVERIVNVFVERAHVHGLSGDRLPESLALERKGIVDLGAELLTGMLAQDPEQVRPPDVRLAARLVIYSVANLAAIGLREHKDEVRSGAYAKEVAQMVTRYLLREG